MLALALWSALLVSAQAEARTGVKPSAATACTLQSWRRLSAHGGAGVASQALKEPSRTGGAPDCLPQVEAPRVLCIAVKAPA